MLKVKVVLVIKKEVLSIKASDVFYYKSNGQHKCTAIYIHIESNVFQGILAKFWLKTKQRWHYKFFDRYELELLCSTVRVKDE